MSGPSGSTYIVRRWSGLGQVALEVLPVLGVGVLLGVLQGRWVAGAVLCAVVLVLAAFAVDRATLAFRVDSSGVTWSRAVPRVVISQAGVRRLDWASVHDLEVVEGEEGPLVGGIFDILDGQVARGSGKASVFGSSRQAIPISAMSISMPSHCRCAAYPVNHPSP